MDKRLLTILRCPATHKGLSVAKRDLISKANMAIAAGAVKNRDGVPVREPLSEGLVTDDGKRLYPLNDGIPVLLEGEAISVDQFD